MTRAARSLAWLPWPDCNLPSMHGIEKSVSFCKSERKVLREREALRYPIAREKRGERKSRREGRGQKQCLI